MTQDEGSATMCDNNGQILFYSNGVFVWNRNHTVMQNGTGLKGDLSSTQSALILPKPSDNNLYYIFTVPALLSTGVPLSYSIIDMTLDGGFGAVTTKNVSLHTPITEKLTATLKSNGTDYWIVAKEYGTDAFLVYSLTAAGVDPNPVVTNVGPVINDLNSEAGYARISPNGSKLCMAYYGNNTSQLFDFDNGTGIVSNPIPLVSTSGCYGVEFSPDNSKLYLMQPNEFVLTQYDLLAGSPTAIQNSALEIAHLGGTNLGCAIKLGPDNKIYVNRYMQNFIAVIDQPNLAGTACNFIDHAIQFSSGTSWLGLPNNLYNYSLTPSCPPSLNNSSSATICSNQTYQLPSGTIVNAAGIYNDTIRSVGSCDSIITTLNLSVFPVGFLNTDVHICSNQIYQLPSGTIVSIAGIYNDTIRSVSSCDSIINAIHVLINDVSSSNMIDSIYEGDPYMLPSGQTVNSPGVYQTVLVNSIGCDSVITTTLIKKQQLLDCLILTNAITPNGDGIHDYWVLYRENCFKKLEVNVYNRYGSLVYHSDDYKNDWSGKYKNKELPDGTYYYIIKVISYNGKEHFFKDNVTIIR